MRLPPIVERELRVVSRRPWTGWARAAVALVGVCVAAGTIAVHLSAGALPGEIGATLFRALSLIAFGLALLAGPFVTADALSSEKRAGTLGLLFLTRLKSGDIVLGKLASTALPAIFWPLAIVPVIALAFPLGGLMPGTFWRMCAGLFVTLCFSLSAGLLLSASCRSAPRAIGGALALVGVVTFGLPWAGSLAPAAGFLALFSPGQVCWSSLETAKSASHYGEAILCVLLESGLFLFLAVAVLPRSWRAGSRHSGGLGLIEVLANLGAAPVDCRERRELLENNPVLWLASRGRKRRRFVWALFAALVVGGMAGTQLLPTGVSREMTLFLGLFGIHAVVKFAVARTACHRFAEDRQSGAFELLLTSPLSERAIVRGWLEGLKRRFLGPVTAIVVVDLVVFVTGLSGRGGGVELDVALLASIGLLVADAYTLCWVGFWLGLSASTPGRAFYLTIGLVLALPWVGFLGILGVFGLVSFGAAMPSIGSLAIGWFVLGYIVDLGFCGWAIGRFESGFREASAERRPWFRGRLRRFTGA